MLKDFALRLFDRLDYSTVALVLGAAMLGAAIFIGSRATGAKRGRAYSRGMLWALVGVVAGAALAATAAFAANSLLMHAEGANHASHIHTSLVLEAAKIGGFLGCGLCALTATAMALRAPSPGQRRPSVNGK